MTSKWTKEISARNGGSSPCDPNVKEAAHLPLDSPYRPPDANLRGEKPVGRFVRGFGVLMMLWGIYVFYSGFDAILAVTTRNFSGTLGIYAASAELQLYVVFSAVAQLAFCSVGLSAALGFRFFEPTIVLAFIALALQVAWSFFVVWPYMFATWDISRPSLMSFIGVLITTAVYAWLVLYYRSMDVGFERDEQIDVIDAS